jgi:hypothetical protein
MGGADGGVRVEIYIYFAFLKIVITFVALIKYSYL